jgi:uncharacterized repeat protein (TIGR01451 family)
LLLALIALAASPVVAGAATVSNTDDAGSGSLRQAIIDANPGDTIAVPAGTYTLTSGELLLNKSLTLTGEGAATTIVRAGGLQRIFHATGPTAVITIAGLTIRDGHVQGTSAIGGAVWNEDASLALRAVVLDNNAADADGTAGNPGGSAYGGAIWNAGVLTIADSTLSGNVASARGGSTKSGGIAFGGGIYNEGTGTVALTATTISGAVANAPGGTGGASGQSAGLAKGAAIYSESTAPISVSATGGALRGNTLDAQAGTGGSGGIAHGGAIYSTGGGVTLTGVAIEDNHLTAAGGSGGSTGQPGGIAEGGGIYFLPAGAEMLTLDGGTVSGNSAVANGGPGSPGGIAEGGGIYSFANVAISRVTVSANVLSARGGNSPSGSGQPGGIIEGAGIYSLTSDPEAFSLSDSTVSANSGDASGGPGSPGGIAQGGGLRFNGSGTKDAHLTNVTITGNSVTAPGNGNPEGGGVYSTTNNPDPLAMVLTNATLSGNSAIAGQTPLGGDIRALGKFKALNTIVSAGSAGGAPQNCSGPITSLGHNLDGADTCNFHAGGDLVGADPQLGPLQDNGGPTPTQAIPTSSPAFDAGASAGCPATDQRGVPRPQVAACDIGAFELELGDLALTKTVSAARAPVGTTVTFTLTVSNAGPSIARATAVSDTLPAALALVSATPSAGSCSGTTVVTCALGDVAANGSATVAIVARGIRAGAVTNTATATTAIVDTNPANNTASAAVTVTPLVVSGARLDPRTFRLGSALAKLTRKVKTGTTISFTLPAPASTTLSFGRRETGRKVRGSCRKKSRSNVRKPRCTRYAAAGKLTVAAHVGVNKLRFQGRLTKRKALRPGRYRLTIVAKDAFGNASKPVKLSFTLLPRAPKPR